MTYFGSLLFIAQAGTGRALLTVTVGSQVSNSVLITYRAPSITSISPAAGVSTAGGDTLQRKFCCRLVPNRELRG